MTTFNIGDIVAYPNEDYAPQLRSGASWYPDAVVIQAQPVILVSREGDMRWSATVQEDKLQVVGKANEKELAKVMARLKS